MIERSLNSSVKAAAISAKTPKTQSSFAQVVVTYFRKKFTFYNDTVYSCFMLIYVLSIMLARIV